MSSPQELYTAFIEAMNARDWPKVQTILAPKPIVNGVETPADALIQQIAGLSAMGPDLVSTIDFVLPSSDGSKAYARVIHRFTLAQDAMGIKATGKPVEFAEASFFWVAEGRVSRTFTIIDMASLQKGEPELFKAQPAMAASIPAPEGTDLLAAYKSYVDCVQRGPELEELSKFCHSKIIVNNEEIELEKFIAILKGAKATIEGMHWNLLEWVVDEQKQQIATRVMLTGKPLEDFAGMPPNGNSVEFPEHVLYQLDGGKIKKIVQLMDLNAYRASLEGGQ